MHFKKERILSMTQGICAGFAILCFVCLISMLVSGYDSETRLIGQVSNWGNDIINNMRVTVKMQKQTMVQFERVKAWYESATKAVVWLSERDKRQQLEINELRARLKALECEADKK